MTTFTFLNVPYTALAAEMTQDYDERTSLISYRTLWSMVASIFGAALPFVLAGAFADMFNSQKIGWSIAAGILGIAAVFPILLTWRVTRGYELFPEQVTVKWSDIRDALLRYRGNQCDGSSSCLFLYLPNGLYRRSNLNSISIFHVRQCCLGTHHQQDSSKDGKTEGNDDFHGRMGIRKWGLNVDGRSR